MSAHDPLKNLQFAAARAAAHVAPGDRAFRVVVYGADGRKVIDVAVPACCCAQESGGEQAVPVIAGWLVTEKGARFDDRAVAVGASRWRLLAVLIGADGKLSAKELARLAFDKDSDEENCRYHINALRKELKAAFPDFEGDILPGEGGYRLVLR